MPGENTSKIPRLSPVHRAHFAAGLLTRLEVPVVLLCAGKQAAASAARLAASSRIFRSSPWSLPSTQSAMS